MAGLVRQEAPEVGSRRGGLGLPIDLIRRFFAESLFKNSTMLVVNLGVGAVAGYGGLALLTRIFSVQDVGISGTAVSAAALIETATLLGVNYSVPRYLPTAKNRTAMINTVVTAVVLITFLASVIFLALPYSRQFFVLGGWLFGLAFIVAMSVQVGTNVLSTVFVADRSSDKLVPVSIAGSLVRLGSPLVFSFIGTLGSFVARVVPDCLAIVLLGVGLARKGHKFRPTLDLGVVREMARFSVGMYIANLIGGLPQMLLPLIALARIGSQQNAYWLVAMSIASTLSLLPSMVTAALLPELSLRPNERPQLLRRAALLTAAAVMPALALAYFAAPFVLEVFGHGYKSGTLPVLRWLIVANFIVILNSVTGAILFMAKKSTMITIVNAVDAVIVIGMAAFWATNSTDLAIAWGVGNVANTVLFSAFAFLAVREVGGQWELLGVGRKAAASVAPADTQQAAIDLPFRLTEEQGALGMYQPYPRALTSPQGLYSVAAVRATEQRLLRTTASRAGAAPARTSNTSEQAFQLLFSLAEQQRAARFGKPRRRSPGEDG